MARDHSAHGKSGLWEVPANLATRSAGNSPRSTTAASIFSTTACDCATTPTRQPAATRDAITCEPKNVFPEPGGPCTATYEESSAHTAACTARTIGKSSPEKSASAGREPPVTRRGGRRYKISNAAAETPPAAGSIASPGEPSTPTASEAGSTSGRDASTERAKSCSDCSNATVGTVAAGAKATGSASCGSSFTRMRSSTTSTTRAKPSALTGSSAGAASSRCAPKNPTRATVRGTYAPGLACRNVFTCDSIASTARAGAWAASYITYSALSRPTLSALPSPTRATARKTRTCPEPTVAFCQSEIT